LTKKTQKICIQGKENVNSQVVRIELIVVVVIVWYLEL